MYDYHVADNMFTYSVIPDVVWMDRLKQESVWRAVDILTLYRAYGSITELNSDVALAQAINETGWFQSDAWELRFNPCGLGITGSNVKGPDLKSIENGIQSHYAHLCCYYFTQPDCPACKLGWKEPRHSFHDGLVSIADLVTGPHKWAETHDYPQRIVKVLNSVANG